ncbi:MAG: cyclic nucleotide-binding domain-containing protein [Hyphomonadaceae bacterium]|nr:cyclic nucleotide-binding domain-containing protein [Hyphomonadaceae bacterium]
MPSIADFCGALPVATFAAGEALLVEGQQTGRFYVLLEGTVEVVKGEDVVINVVADVGAVFGEMSVLLDKPHMATVRAVDQVRAHVVEDGAAFLESHPEVSAALARLLAQRLHGVTTYLVDLKQQFEDQTNHLGMVDEILESLAHDQPREFTPGSDREPEY